MSVLNQFKEAIRIQQNKENESYDEQIRLPLEERVAKGVTMTNYTNASSNQGLLGSRAPGFHLFAGWYQYNKTRLPNNNCEIVIKSGTYGRIVLGGTPGTSSGQGHG